MEEELVNKSHFEKGVSGSRTRNTRYTGRKVVERTSGGGVNSGNCFESGKIHYGQKIPGSNGKAFGGGITMGTCDNFGGGIG